jgi:hypothetical protein
MCPNWHSPYKTINLNFEPAFCQLNLYSGYNTEER